MKKFFATLGVIVLACTIAAGGYIAGQKTQIGGISMLRAGKTTENTAVAEPTKAPAEAVPAKADEKTQTTKNTIEKSVSSKVQDNYSEVKKVSAVFSDNNKADICLYTSAQKDSDGEFMWDDGNQWVLEVKMKDTYTLLDKYVQMGKVNIIVGGDEKGEGVITAVISTGSGLTVKEYTYNGTAFEEQTVYDSGALNVWGSTF